jgi:hypothetical protein
MDKRTFPFQQEREEGEQTFDFQQKKKILLLFDEKPVYAF